MDHRKDCFPHYYYKDHNKTRVVGRGGALLCLLLCAALCLGGCSLTPLTSDSPDTLSYNATDGETSENLPITETGESVPETESKRDAVKLPSVSSGEHYSVREIAAIALDSVVEIRTEAVVTGSYFRQYVTSGAGSGVIIDPSGDIVTNCHVVENATSITVRLHNGEEYSASLVGTDSATDIAVIRIDANGLTAATLGDSADLFVGDPVVAIGNPLGELGGTVTNGIISALARQISIDGQKMTLLQTNAAINPGNSGGGLFNEAGELIGIVNAKYSDDGIEGLGFAIPINTAKPVIEDLLNYGYARGRVHSGATFVDVHSSYSALYYGVSIYGTYVYSVEADSDAARAGLKSGDILTAIDGTEITSVDMAEAMIAAHNVGDTLELSVTRVTRTGSSFQQKTETEELTLRLVLTEYVPAYISQGGFSNSLGA